MSFNCNYCNTTYTTKKIHDKHLLTQKHITNKELFEKKFVCKPCNTATSVYRDYEKHLKTEKHITNTQEVPKNICDICAKTYKTKTGLVNHKKLCKKTVVEQPIPATISKLIILMLDHIMKQDKIIQAYTKYIEHIEANDTSVADETVADTTVTEPVEQPVM